MISNHLDHPGLLLMMYPRPVFVAAAVLDFFPIEGTRKTVREVTELYRRFHHEDRIGWTRGLSRPSILSGKSGSGAGFSGSLQPNAGAARAAAVKELDDKTLQCTRTGQVMLDFEDARSLMDVIRNYYLEHKNQPAKSLKQLYQSELNPRISSWNVAEFERTAPGRKEIRWEALGRSDFDGATIERYSVHHSEYLELPLLYIHKAHSGGRRVMLWIGENGKATAEDWPALSKYLGDGYDIISFDPRGLGETRMPYKALSPDDPALAQLDTEHAYVNPLSGVLSDYVYNSLLTGRPYFLQMIDDAAIAMRFFQGHVNPRAEFIVTGTNGAYTLASAISESLPNVELSPRPDAQVIEWSEIVDRKTEIWPIEYLLPGGAYIH